MSAILFDFSGTLVSYSPSRVDQGYSRCHAFLREHGLALSYPDFLIGIDACFAEFDRRSDTEDREFSMGEVAAAFYAGPSAAGIRAFLIDPAKSREIPDDRRIDSVFDLRPGGSTGGRRPVITG